jgi:hypothetical protein
MPSNWSLLEIVEDTEVIDGCFCIWLKGCIIVGFDQVTESIGKALIIVEGCVKSAR